MSNPDPNLPPDLAREWRRHVGPLIGMALVVLFAVGLILWWLAEDTATAPGPEGDGGGMTQEQAMEPPASPNEGGVDPGGTAGPATGEDAVGDPVPGEGSPLNPDE